MSAGRRRLTEVAKGSTTKVVAFPKQSPPLNVPGTVTRVGWVPPKQLSVEDWLKCGQAFDLVEGAAQWWKGDWWKEGETRKYGDGEELAKRAGVNYETIKQLASVARAYELCVRTHNLSFAHHLIAMTAPDKDRLRWLKRAEENGWTTAQLRKEITDWKRGISRASLQLTASAAGLATLLYADPPWQYANSGFMGAAEEHYPTMSTDEICALPVSQIVAEEAVLFLWATSPMLTDALRVIEAWGFAYKTNLVWTKDRQTYGKLGFYVFGQHELLLVATKGVFLPDGELQPSIITAKKAEHSRKPTEAYEIIEKTLSIRDPDGARAVLPWRWA
jgi:N6-adenosine-specific RNA methylase IME4